MALSFLTPVASVVALTGLVPLAVHLLRERHGRRVRATLGLAEPGTRSDRALVVALVAVPLLAGVAAAQPVLDRAQARQERLDAEVLFVFDTTRSMYASAGVGQPTRLERARRIANEVRTALPDVRAGAASLTDRTLPHLFPTIDGSSFRRTVARSIDVERPPPATHAGLATDLNSLAAVGRQAYFSPATSKRLLIVLTDGETEGVKPTLPAALSRAGIRTVFVHVWSSGESIFLTSRPEPEYRPDPSSRDTLAQYAAAVEGDALSEDADEEVVALARAALGDGPTRSRSQRDLLALMPYVILAAVLPLALVLRRRNVGAYNWARMAPRSSSPS